MARNDTIEGALIREEVQWEYREGVLLSQIDERASLENQARTVPLNKGLVESYALAMIDGVQFPPLIAYPNGKAWVLIDGNHRYQAAKKIERNAVDVYLVKESDPLIIERMTQTWNDMNGARFEPEERTAKAIRWMKRHSWTIRDTAQLFRMAEHILGEAVRDEEVRGALLQEGFNPAEFKVNDLRQLHQFLGNRVVLRDLVGAKKDLRLDTIDLGRLTKEVKTQTSEKAQCNAIAAFVKDPQNRKEAKRKGDGRYHEGRIRRRLFQCYSELNNIYKQYPSAVQCQLHDEEEIERLARVNAESQRGFNNVVKTYRADRAVAASA